MTSRKASRGGHNAEAARILRLMWKWWRFSRADAPLDAMLRWAERIRSARPREEAGKGSVSPWDSEELASSDGRRREARQLLARAFRLSRRPAAIEQLLELMGKVGDYLKRTSDPNDILREAAERGNHERRRDRD